MLGGLLQTQFPSAAGKPGALDNLKLSVQGNVVYLSLLVPEREIRKALQAQMASTTGQGQPADDSKPSQRSGEIMIQSSPKDMGTVVIRQPQDR